MKLLESKSIYYDDVNLIAQPNYKLVSRKDVPEEKWRIIASPMPSVIGSKFSIEAIKLGISVVLHRFGSVADNVKMFNDVAKEVGDPNNKNKLWCSIGLNDNNRLMELKRAGCKLFLIDVANAYLQSVVDYTKATYEYLDILNKQYIFEETMPYHVMVGNIHSSSGVELYCKFQHINLRIGIGNGAQCETSTKATGYGRGQITELNECYNWINNHDNIGLDYYMQRPVITADGGIKNGNCAAKAFACGSTNVMLGTYFGIAEEAQNVIDGEYKIWGCASEYNQAKYGEIRRHSEGRVSEIDKKTIVPLKKLIDDLWGGVSSAVSYSGGQTVNNLRNFAIFEIKK